jgi:hypothetical protein
LEQNNYEVLLIVASLAHHTRFGFAMKPTADINNAMGNEDGDAMTRGGRRYDNKGNEGVLQQP